MAGLTLRHAWLSIRSRWRGRHQPHKEHPISSNLVKEKFWFSFSFQSVPQKQLASPWTRVVLIRLDVDTKIFSFLDYCETQRVPYRTQQQMAFGYYLQKGFLHFWRNVTKKIGLFLLFGGDLLLLSNTRFSILSCIRAALIFRDNSIPASSELQVFNIWIYSL